MIIKSLLKYSFAIQPNRSNRFFSLTVHLKEQLPISQKIQQSHVSHLKSYEQTGAVILSVKSIQKKKLVYFFQSQNQIQPFKFYKQHPFTLHNFVQNYLIQEFQMKNKTRNKQLAPNYLRE